MINGLILSLCRNKQDTNWALDIYGTGLCLSFTSIGSTYGDTFQCNMNVSLVCQTESRPVNIVIRINKTTAAYCLNTKCFENEVILGEYTVSNDTSLGILRLHIHKVSVADARNIFTCEGDSTSQSIQPVVKEFPTYHSAAINVIENNSVVQIIVTSGCVLLETRLRMEWTKIEAAPNAVPEDLKASGFSQKDMLDSTVCDLSNNCGEDSLASTLTFIKEIGGTTKEYYIQCSIVVSDDHAPENVILVTNNTFKLLDSVIPVKPKEDDKRKIILIVVLVLVIPYAIQLIMAITLHVITRKYSETSAKRGKAAKLIGLCIIPYIGFGFIMKFYCLKVYQKYYVSRHAHHPTNHNDDRTYRSSTELVSGNNKSSAINGCSNPQYDAVELNGKPTVTRSDDLKSGVKSKTDEDGGQNADQSQNDSVAHTDIKLEHHLEIPDYKNGGGTSFTNQRSMTRGTSAVLSSYTDLIDVGKPYEHLHPQRKDSDHYTKLHSGNLHEIGHDHGDYILDQRRKSKSGHVQFH